MFIKITLRTAGRKKTRMKKDDEVLWEDKVGFFALFVHAACTIILTICQESEA